MLECEKGDRPVYKSMRQALTDWEPEKITYWIVVGDGDWLVGQIYNETPSRWRYSCLYRHARARGEINGATDRLGPSVPGGAWELWRINREGVPVKVEPASAHPSSQEGLKKSLRLYSPVSRAGGITGRVGISEAKATFDNFNGVLVLERGGRVRMIDTITPKTKKHLYETAFRVVNWREFEAANSPGPCLDAPLRWISIRDPARPASAATRRVLDSKKFVMRLYSLEDLRTYAPDVGGLCLESTYSRQ